MRKYISEIYEVDESTYIVEERDEIVSSYTILLLAHNGSGFDSWVVLNSLDKETKDLEEKKNCARRLISLSFRCSVKINKTVEVPQNVKFTCTRLHISVSLKRIGREYGWQPEFSNGEISHSENTKYEYNELRHIWEPYLQSDVLYLAIVFARQTLEMQKMTKQRVKES